MVGAVTLTMGYGIEVQRTNDPYVKIAEETIAHLSDAGRPGSFLVEFMHLLEYIPEWLPGGGWKARIRKLRREMHDFMNKPFEASLKAIVGSMFP